MDEDIAREARRLIQGSVREAWEPRMRALIGTIAARRKIGWGDACDVAELSLLTTSEEIKLEAEKRAEPSEESVGWNLAVQAMLEIIADVRTKGAHESTR